MTFTDELPNIIAVVFAVIPLDVAFIVLKLIVVEFATKEDPTDRVAALTTPV